MAFPDNSYLPSNAFLKNICPPLTIPSSSPDTSNRHNRRYLFENDNNVFDSNVPVRLFAPGTVATSSLRFRRIKSWALLAFSIFEPHRRAEWELLDLEKPCRRKGRSRPMAMHSKGAQHLTIIQLRLVFSEIFTGVDALKSFTKGFPAGNTPILATICLRLLRSR
eukprot:GHVU01212761.1.p1 GENE.GHVU01212761.1~~GHVU01212761.1.p1  ORF type:complete len:165 (+),score=7.45 GHVU01212761.1:3682-4176(+)